jgi:hypothetical protein
MSKRSTQTLTIRNVRLSQGRIGGLLQAARKTPYKIITIDNARFGETKASAVIELIVTALGNSPGLRELAYVHCASTLRPGESQQFLRAIKHPNLRIIELEGFTDGSAFATILASSPRLERFTAPQMWLDPVTRAGLPKLIKDHAYISELKTGCYDRWHSWGLSELAKIGDATEHSAATAHQMYQLHDDIKSALSANYDVGRMLTYELSFVCVALAPLRLPHYVILWITDWLPKFRKTEWLVERGSEFVDTTARRKLQMIESIARAYARAVG